MAAVENNDLKVYIFIITCDTGGSYRSNCNFVATRSKSSGWKATTSFTILLVELLRVGEKKYE